MIFPLVILTNLNPINWHIEFNQALIILFATNKDQNFSVDLYQQSQRPYKMAIEKDQSDKSKFKIPHPITPNFSENNKQIPISQKKKGRIPII